jgi:hypothetical protein
MKTSAKTEIPAKPFSVREMVVQNRASSVFKLASVGALICSLTFLSSAHAQSSQSATQDAAQAPCGTTASLTTPQNGSAPQNNSNISAQAKNVENAAKQLGSLFKKKRASTPAASANPCPAPAASAPAADASANAPAPGAAPGGVAAAPVAANSAQPSAPQSGSVAQVVASAQSQLPQAPAGGLDPSKLPDIVGVRIGTPTNKIIAQLDSLYPLNPHDPGSHGKSYIKYAPTSDPPYVSSLFYQRPFPEGCSPGGQCSDVMRVILSGPPEARAVRLERDLSYESGHQPTSDTLKTALIQKYGPNFTQFPVMTLVWAFDEQGKPLTLSKNDAQCARGESPISQQGFPPTTNYMMTSYLGLYTPTPQQQQYQIANMLRSKCVKGVVVKAEIAGPPGGLASQLIVTITEIAADLRDAFAAELYLQKAANAQANQQLKNDQQQAAPKF